MGTGEGVGSGVAVGTGVGIGVPSATRRIFSLYDECSTIRGLFPVKEGVKETSSSGIIEWITSGRKIFHKYIHPQKNRIAISISKAIYLFFVFFFSAGEKGISFLLHG